MVTELPSILWGYIAVRFMVDHIECAFEVVKPSFCMPRSEFEMIVSIEKRREASSLIQCIVAWSSCPLQQVISLNCTTPLLITQDTTYMHTRLGVMMMIILTKFCIMTSC